MKLIKARRAITKATMAISKKSPLILTVVGIAGVGATAYFAYKSAKKVEVIVESIEAAREEGIEIDRLEVVKDIAGAIALPVLTGLASITAIAFSYRIQNVRIGGLASAVAAIASEHKQLQDKIKVKYGEEEYNNLITHSKFEKTTMIDDQGVAQDVIAEELTTEDDDMMYGRWFHKSSKFAADRNKEALDYNKRVIMTTVDSMDLKLFRNGFLVMNDLLDALGFERTAGGAVMGWGVGEFTADYRVVQVLQADGQYEPRIFVKWTQPKSIYDAIEYKA